MQININVQKIGMWLGVVGGAITVFTLVVDWRISQLEARMVDRFALLREINTLRENVSYLEGEMLKYHLQGPFPEARVDLLTEGDLVPSAK